MSQATRQEAEPLLQPQQGHDVNHAAPTATIVNIHDQDGPRVTPGTATHAPKPRDERLQHHRAMVRYRFSANWWIEWIIIFIVFSVTGSSTMLVVKPLMKALGLTGSLGQGPWSFRIAYVVLTLPLYSCMLLLISSI
ncbi:hypothetical protein BX616_006778, partial [Lobosporangium transversale]